MQGITIEQAQADMREAHGHGAPGVLVSGLVWLGAGAVGLAVSVKAGVYALLLGGVFIFPLSVALARLVGRRGLHARGNPLGTLAAEGTWWMMAGIAVAFGLSLLRVEWFFPAMLLAIGGRYLSFQTLYGLRHYWFLGGALCALGLAAAVLRVPPALAALAGGALELLFAALLWRRRA